MLLHRCVSMGSEWVDGWTDGQTDAHISMPAVLRAARYATTVDARSPVTVSRCPSPVPIPIPSLSPAPGAALRSIPLCRDAGMGSTELPPARISPLHPRSRPPLTPPPVRISPPGGTCRPLEMGQNSTRCTNRRTLRMLRAPRARGPQSPGGMAAAPASLRGVGGWGGRAAPLVRTTAALSARFGSDRLGPARLRPARGGARSSAAALGGGGGLGRGGAEDARLGAARLGCAHPSASLQPRIDPAAFRGCRSRPRAAAELCV